MLKPDAYDTIGYTTYACALCMRAVGCEENLRYDKQGNEMYYYTPISRYWSLAGVFCSVDCSHALHLIQIEFRCWTCRDSGDMLPGIACTNCRN